MKLSDTGFSYYEIYNLHRNDDANYQGDGQDGVDQDDDEKEKDLTNRQCIKGSVEGEFNSFTFLYLLFKCHNLNFKFHCSSLPPILFHIDIQRQIQPRRFHFR